MSQKRDMGHPDFLSAFFSVYRVPRSLREPSAQCPYCMVAAAMRQSSAEVWRVESAESNGPCQRPPNR
jgi:hypothetical protein